MEKLKNFSFYDENFIKTNQKIPEDESLTNKTAIRIFRKNQKLLPEKTKSQLKQYFIKTLSDRGYVKDDNEQSCLHVIESLGSKNEANNIKNLLCKCASKDLARKFRQGMSTVEYNRYMFEELGFSKEEAKEIIPDMDLDYSKERPKEVRQVIKDVGFGNAVYLKLTFPGEYPQYVRLENKSKSIWHLETEYEHIEEQGVETKLVIGPWDGMTEETEEPFDY